MDWHGKEINSVQKTPTKLRPPVSCAKMKNDMMPLQRPAEFIKGIQALFSIIGDAKMTKTLNMCVPGGVLYNDLSQGGITL